MTLAELLEALRIRLDDTANGNLWSDETLIGFLNEAVRQATIRLRSIRDAETEAVCKITLVPGQLTYDVHPAVLSVCTATIDDRRTPLCLTTTKRLEKIEGAWYIDTDTGCPEFLVLDYTTGKLALYPRPDAAGTLNLSVWRMTLDSEQMLAEGDPPYGVHPAHHFDLLDWAEHLAYGIKDAETHDPDRSAMAEARFTAKFGRLPSALEMRLWGLQRIVGVPAEFL